MQLYNLLLIFLTSKSVTSATSSSVLKLWETTQDSQLKDLLERVKEIFSASTRSTNGIFEDAYLNITELATKYGYDLEEHEVETQDGHILALHRIPRGRNNSAINRTPVFLMHGLMDSSDSWLLQGPEQALGYILADQGYDVWMGNARGNKYSHHANLSKTQSDYWKFSWEEIGLYDLPAMVDYILNQTTHESIYYVGHSQGSTTFFVMASMRPEYNNKIKMMFALSPVAYLGNARSPILRMFSPANKLLVYWLSSFNIYAPSANFVSKLMSSVCFLIPRCDNLLYLVVGNNHKLINESLLPVVFSHLPSGSSTLQFLHYWQLVESGRFCRYDYGEEMNVQLYQSVTPPDYDLSKITAPVVMFYSSNDWLADPLDVKKLMSQLPNVYHVHHIEEFNHLDFLYAFKAKELIYNEIPKNLKGINHVN